MIRAMTGIAALGVMASPALAESFTMAQLLNYDFEVVAAIPGGGNAGRLPAEKFDTLYLEGRLPGNSQKIVARCVVRASADQAASNCQQVY